MAKKKLTSEQVNEEAAKAAIQEALDKYNCELRARVVLEGGSTETLVVVRSKTPVGE